MEDIREVIKAIIAFSAALWAANLASRGPQKDLDDLKAKEIDPNLGAYIYRWKRRRMIAWCLFVFMAVMSAGMWILR